MGGKGFRFQKQMEHKRTIIKRGLYKPTLSSVFILVSLFMRFYLASGVVKKVKVLINH